MRSTYLTEMCAFQNNYVGGGGVGDASLSRPTPSPIFSEVMEFTVVTPDNLILLSPPRQCIFSTSDQESL